MILIAVSGWKDIGISKFEFEARTQKHLLRKSREGPLIKKKYSFGKEYFFIQLNTAKDFNGKGKWRNRLNKKLTYKLI